MNFFICEMFCLWNVYIYDCVIYEMFNYEIAIKSFLCKLQNSPQTFAVESGNPKINLIWIPAPDTNLSWIRKKVKNVSKIVDIFILTTLLSENGFNTVVKIKFMVNHSNQKTRVFKFFIISFVKFRKISKVSFSRISIYFRKMLCFFPRNTKFYNFEN